MASSSSSSCSSVQPKYQVFLSFRGEDTRNNFISHLHEALDRKGIGYFIDYQLVRGEEISQALLTAIEESKISIIVLSKNYASSSWCLDELSKILECKKTMGQKVVPIFYHVDPSDVRKQQGSFEVAFANHHQRFKDGTDKVERRRAALKEVGSLSGYHIQPHLPESTLIAEIVDDIAKKLMYKFLCDTKRLVGIDSHIEKIESLLCFDSIDVRIIGITGMGGIGKTTIAEAMYNLFSDDFDGSCFINVKEELNGGSGGQVRLREKLFSKILEDKNLNLPTSFLPFSVLDRLYCKKIFIVLDDVNHSTQLLNLLPKKNHFKPGSRIILTSRDKQVLKQVIDEMYEVEEMVDDEALHLFRMYAFQQSQPEEVFVELSKKVIHYIKGLPLALRVVGSALYCKSKRDWESYLITLKESSHLEIDEVLKISYDGLNVEEKSIFLDIACFFRWEQRNFVESILDGCYNSVTSRISVLIDKSLITDSYNMLGMHDLLQLMAWNIIHEESKERGERSRLWTPEDIYHVLKNNTGTKSVEGMFLDMSEIGKLCFSPTAFEKMCNLRLLNFYYTSYKREGNVYLSQQDLEYLPDSLRYLHWDGYPSKFLPSSFCPMNLVQLSMPNSHVEQLWNGVQDLVKLKQLNLSGSKNLIKIPKLSKATNLECIKLAGCRSLVEVPSSIQYLNKLSHLVLDGCKKLKNLPSSIKELKSLEVLSLRHCSNFTKFPEIPVNLLYLNLIETAIEQVPSSIECASRLASLYLESSTKLRRLPRNILMLKNLDIFGVYGFSKLEVIQELLGTVQRLSISPYYEKATLHRSRDSGILFLELPNNVENLKSFKLLDAGNCNLFTCMSSLTELSLSGNNFETIPASIKQLLTLKSLKLTVCKRLRSLPELPPNLQILDSDSCSSLEEVSTLFTLGHGGVTDYSFVDCLKLDQIAIRHILAKTQLWIQHRATADLKLDCQGNFDRSSLTICLPGSEIPEWFSRQNTGSSVTTQPLLYGDYRKFVGFVLCAVVTLEDESSIFMNVRVECKHNFKTNDGCHCAGSTNVGSKIIHGDSDHMFLNYNEWVDDWMAYDGFSEASFEFSIYDYWAKCRVKKCGVHVVYRQNDQMISLPYNARVIQPSSPFDSTSLSFNSGVIDQEPTQDGTIIKRRRDPHHNNKAKPSESLSSEQEEEKPYPKRLKRIIMTNRTLLFKSKQVVRRRPKCPRINQPQ